MLGACDTCVRWQSRVINSGATVDGLFLFACLFVFVIFYAPVFCRFVLFACIFVVVVVVVLFCFVVFFSFLGDGGMGWKH